MHQFLASLVVALTLTGCNDSDDKNLAAAEMFVGAFYSFNAQKLEATLSHAEDSIPSMVFYQGWAEGGNYQIVNRMPCKSENAESVSCSITVKDDHMGALGIDFDVTDTFHFSLSEGRIISVRNSSNDLQVYLDAEKWVRRKRPELIRESCQGFFDGGPTPGKCAQAMVRGYAEFAASDEFSELQ